MTQTCNDSLIISVPSKLLDPIHNKLVVKSYVNSLPDGRKWWIHCYPADKAESRKDALILMLRLTGGPASVSTHVSIKKTTFSHNQKFDVNKESDHNIVLLLGHEERALKSDKTIDIEVHGTFYFPNVNSQAVLPTLSGGFVLTEADVRDAAMGYCRSTSKVDVPSIPGLQWWLDYYPNGNSGKQAKTLMIFLRVSMAPVNVKLKYAIKNATRTVISGTKSFALKSVNALRDIVQLKHDNSNFKDGIVDGALTFVCFPTFTVPTEKVIPRPPSVKKTITGVMNSMSLQQASQSTSVESVVTPKLKSVPNSVIDSCTIDLNEADFLPSNRGKPKATPKRNIPEVPGLQWWIECYPAGNSTRDPMKRMVIFLRASAPIKMTATYYVPGTAIRRQLTDTIRSKAAQGFDYLIPHGKLLTRDAFKTGPIKLCCDVIIHMPQKSPPASVVAKPIKVRSPKVPAVTASVGKPPSIVTDSTFIVLNESVDLDPKHASKSISTLKRRVKGIPNLEWWLEIFPAGNSVKQAKTFIAFVRVSTVPVSVKAVYTFARTDITRQIQCSFISTGSRGANFTVSHATLTAANAFTNGNATFKCTVTFNPPEDQSNQMPSMPSSVSKPALQKAAKPTPVGTEKLAPQVAVIPPLPKQPIEQLSRSTHTLKFYAKREHFTNPNYIITSSKQKIQDDVEWFITSTPGGKDIDGNGCLTVYLNASTNVSGNVKYEVEGTHLRGSMNFRDSALIQIKQILHTDLDAYPLVKQFDIKIVATLGSSSRSTTPTTSSGFAEMDSSEWESDDDEEWQNCMTDNELLMYRLKMQDHETNKVLELLKRGSPVLIADGADFL
uniref:Ribonucleases P/MRP protein subunit POP1 n=1 Tax=Panagrellus redivivus TaxID=6233 RepID=A0A7E4VA79_PANRE